jgi:hypothetical protein
MLFSSEKVAPHDAEQQLKDASKYLETIRPLVHSIYSNRAVHLIGQGMGMFTEFILYLLSIASFLFLFIMNKTFPFYILGEIIDMQIYKEALQSKGDIDAFHLGVKGLVVLIGLLFLSIALIKRSSRHQRALLQQSGKELKAIEDYFTEKTNTLQKLMPQNQVQPEVVLPAIDQPNTSTTN